MSETRKIRIGLPTGNLNKPLPKDDKDKNNYRGHTAELLRLAGFKMDGYEPGDEGNRGGDDKDISVSAEGEEDIEFFCMKPKQLPELLERGYLDIAIIGKDSIEEYYSGLWQRSTFRQLCEQSESERWVDWDKVLAKNKRQLLEIDKQGNAEGLHRRVPLILFKLIFGRPFKFNQYDFEIYPSGKGMWEKTRKAIENAFIRDETTSDRIDSNDLYDILGNSNCLCDILDLGYGKVNIRWELSPKENKHGIFAGDKSKTGGLSIVSAYPNITYREVCKNIDFDLIEVVDSSKKHAALQKYSLVKIRPLTSRLEEMIGLGLADLVVDNVASGESYKKAGLVLEGEPIMTSTVHLYAHPEIVWDYKEFKLWDLWNVRRESSRGEKMHKIVTRLKEASHKYALERKDSIWYPTGRPAEAK